MRSPLRARSWSPYVVGAGIGVLSWFAFLTADHPLGVSTVFEHTAALAYQLVAPQAAAENAYFVESTPKIGWQSMLVVGVFLGSLLSASLSGDRTHRAVPSLWARRFSGRVWLRLLAAFFGAGLMLFGARLAGGCTSGHAISGTMQLAVSSWLFGVVFFAVGIATAFLLYGKMEQQRV